MMISITNNSIPPIWRYLQSKTVQYSLFKYKLIRFYSIYIDQILFTLACFFFIMKPEYLFIHLYRMHDICLTFQFNLMFFGAQLLYENYLSQI